MNPNVFQRLGRAAHVLLVVLIAGLAGSFSAVAADRTALERDARQAYQKLTARVPAAKALARDAMAVLVFPKITSPAPPTARVPR